MLLRRSTKEHHQGVAEKRQGVEEETEQRLQLRGREVEGKSGNSCTQGLLHEDRGLRVPLESGSSAAAAAAATRESLWDDDVCSSLVSPSPPLETHAPLLVCLLPPPAKTIPWSLADTHTGDQVRVAFKSS